MKHQLLDQGPNSPPKLKVELSHAEIERQARYFHICTVIVDMGNGKEAAAGFCVGIDSIGKPYISTEDFSNRTDGAVKARPLRQRKAER